MSKELWEDNLALWETQDKMNELHSQRIDQLTEAVKQLSEVLAKVLVADKAICTGKHCKCGKVAH
jgi:hypothetical protein